MRLSELLKRLHAARAKVQARINQHDGSRYARGLSTEGWLGGYLQALDDVDGMARHGCPNDPRSFWRQDEP